MRWAYALGLAGCLLGCAFEEAPPPPPGGGNRGIGLLPRGQAVVPEVERPEGVETIERPTLQADLIRGDLGGFLFDSLPYDMELERAPGWAAVGIWAEDRGTYAYTMLVVEGGLDHPALTAGAELAFSPHRVTPSAAETGLQVGILGCAGVDEGIFAYDQFADDVRISVVPEPKGPGSDSDTPSRRRLQFEGSFWDGSVVEGSVLF
ncbi:MAG: hypothetical protein AAGF12_27035 [Myxococcota bacterium]